MKGKLLAGLLLSTGMILQVQGMGREITAGDTLQDAATKMMWDTVKNAIPMPDDVNTKTGIMAGVGLAAGLGLYFGADAITNISGGKVGEWLTKATLNNIGGSDLLKGIGIWTGAMGVSCVYANGPDVRKTVTSAFLGNALLHQVKTPGVVEPGELTTIAKQAVLGIAALAKLKDILPWIGLGSK